MKKKHKLDKEQRLLEKIAGNRPVYGADTKCEKCDRPGKLICQTPMPAQPLHGIPNPWVFRYYLCRWHLAADNRWRKQHQQLKTSVLRKLEDHEVLHELNINSNEQ